VGAKISTNKPNDGNNAWIKMFYRSGYGGIGDIKGAVFGGFILGVLVKL
jgi:branched-subunit amino acid ABC-type transport system permease component